MSTAYRHVLLGTGVLIAGLSATMRTASAAPQDDGTTAFPVAAAGASRLTTFSPTAGQRPPTETGGTVPIRRLEYSGEVLEPDPATYDQEGVQRWWRDYQSRHHDGQ